MDCTEGLLFVTVDWTYEGGLGHTEVIMDVHLALCEGVILFTIHTQRPLGEQKRAFVACERKYIYFFFILLLLRFFFSAPM